MPASTRPLRLDQWGISWEEYKELTYFCLQYRQKLKQADALLTIPSTTATPATYHVGGVEYGTFLPHGGTNKTGDPVAATAEKRERLLRDVRMIERACMEACSPDHVACYDVLLRAVTTRDGTRKVLARSNAPIGERQFYKLRRRFFWILKNARED